MTTYVDTELDLSPIQVPEYAQDATLAERFAAFHEANPHVARYLESLAEQWFAAGHERIGVKALYERLRWEIGVQTTESVPSLNNNWTAFYGRVLLERRPEWSSRIALRTQKAVKS